jgi:hypothetical protein
MGTNVLRGLHGARLAVGRRHRLGWCRRRLVGMCGFSLTQGALRSLGQGSKRFGFLGARASWWLGWHDRLATGSGMIGPQHVEHEEDTPQSYEPELVEKEGPVPWPLRLTPS